MCRKISLDHFSLKNLFLQDSKLSCKLFLKIEIGLIKASAQGNLSKQDALINRDGFSPEMEE